MPLRPSRFTSLVLSCVIPLGAPLAAEPRPNAIQLMNNPGPEASALQARTGRWRVEMRLWPAPGSKPIVQRDMLAERSLIGSFLAETIRPVPGTGQPDFSRISYLHYNRVEGRWQYVSMDTRFPAGIMPAYSHAPSKPGTLELQFQPLAFPGWGTSVEGWMMQSSYEVAGIGTDRETARQYWTRADGTARRWLAVEYVYTRLHQE
jgi:hypothetical protein